MPKYTREYLQDILETLEDGFDLKQALFWIKKNEKSSKPCIKLTKEETKLKYSLLKVGAEYFILTKVYVGRGKHGHVRVGVLFDWLNKKIKVDSLRAFKSWFNVDDYSKLEGTDLTLSIFQAANNLFFLHKMQNRPGVYQDMPLFGIDLNIWLQENKRQCVPFYQLCAFAIGCTKAIQEFHATAYQDKQGVYSYYAHGDVKPDNFVLSLDEKMIRLIDFDFALKVNQPFPEGRLAGTPYYMAPELLANAGNTVRQQADYYALAAVIGQILGDKHIFKDKRQAYLGTLHIDEAKVSQERWRLEYIMSKPLSFSFGHLSQQLPAKKIEHLKGELSALGAQDPQNRAHDVRGILLCLQDLLQLSYELELRKHFEPMIAKQWAELMTRSISLKGSIIEVFLEVLDNEPDIPALLLDELKGVAVVCNALLAKLSTENKYYAKLSEPLDEFWSSRFQSCLTFVDSAELSAKKESRLFDYFLQQRSESSGSSFFNVDQSSLIAYLEKKVLRLEQYYENGGMFVLFRNEKYAKAQWIKNKIIPKLKGGESLTAEDYEWITKHTGLGYFFSGLQQTKTERAMTFMNN